jgi:hypothetical protein
MKKKVDCLCNKCEHFKLVDDGNVIAIKCFALSDKGRVISMMHRYLLRKKDSVIITLPKTRLYELEDKISEWRETHNEPYWCPKRKGE